MQSLLRGKSRLYGFLGALKLRHSHVLELLDLFLPALVFSVIAALSLFGGVRFCRRRQRPAQSLPDWLLTSIDAVRHFLS